MQGSPGLAAELHETGGTLILVPAGLHGLIAVFHQFVLRAVRSSGRNARPDVPALTPSIVMTDEKEVSPATIVMPHVHLHWRRMRGPAMAAIRKTIRDIQIGDNGSLSINGDARYLRWKPGRPYVLLSGLYTHDQLRAVADYIVENGGDDR